MIVLHYIICFFHTNFLIKWYGIFICYQIYCNILFTSCFIMCHFHKSSANSLSFIISVNP